MAAVVLFWAVIVSIVGYFLVTHAPSSKFCDAGMPIFADIVYPINKHWLDVHASYDNCVLCPPHGICRDGKLYCETGYVPSGSVCVEDKDIARMSNTIAGMQVLTGKIFYNNTFRGRTSFVKGG